LQELIQRQASEAEAIKNRQQDELATFTEDCIVYVQAQKSSHDTSYAQLAARHEQEMAELKVGSVSNFN
jgi:hypothetical protein